MAKPNKPATRIVPSDDFTVTIGGTVSTPHAGECVEFRPHVPIGLLRAANRIRGLATQLDALRDDKGEIPPDQFAAARSMQDAHYDDLCQFVARVVVAWDWTDDDGNPLPQPDGTDGPINLLSDDEVYYLFRAAQGQNPAALGNASRPSETTSSAIGIPTSRT